MCAHINNVQKCIKLQIVWPMPKDPSKYGIRGPQSVWLAGFTRYKIFEAWINAWTRKNKCACFGHRVAKLSIVNLFTTQIDFDTSINNFTLRFMHIYTAATLSSFSHFFAMQKFSVRNFFYPLGYNICLVKLVLLFIADTRYISSLTQKVARSVIIAESNL